MKFLHIVPGFFCNFNCSHCLNDSGTWQTNNDLSLEEKEIIKKDISHFSPEVLRFTGGEPTLYIETINELVSSHPDKGKVNISITTNAWFAVDREKTESMLERVKYLNHINISLDIFHNPECDFKNVELIKEYCDLKKIRLTVTCAISNPVELIKLKMISNDLDLDINYQKVLECGRAKENGIQYIFKSFEENSVQSFCPNRNTFSYYSKKRI